MEMQSAASMPMQSPKHRRMHTITYLLENRNTAQNMRTNGTSRIEQKQNIKKCCDKRKREKESVREWEKKQSRTFKWTVYKRSRCTKENQKGKQIFPFMKLVHALTAYVICYCCLYFVYVFSRFSFLVGFYLLVSFFLLKKEKICCVKLVVSFSVLYLYSTWKSIYNLSVGVCLCSMHAYTHVLYIYCIYHTIHLKYKPHRVRRTSGIKNTRITAFEFAFQHIDEHAVGCCLNDLVILYALCTMYISF